MATLISGNLFPIVNRWKAGKKKTRVLTHAINLNAALPGYLKPYSRINVHLDQLCGLSYIQYIISRIGTNRHQIVQLCPAQPFMGSFVF